MNVLSLFDGMSCGQIALKELGIEPNIYYASEIENQKSQTLRLGGSGMYDLVYQKDRIRRLTPVERARLQTIPEWYKWECSATQQCKMLGNEWTVDVVAHILSHMKLNEIE